jgi:hypothetical protein
MPDKPGGMSQEAESAAGACGASGGMVRGRIVGDAKITGGNADVCERKGVDKKAIRKLLEGKE